MAKQKGTTSHPVKPPPIAGRDAWIHQARLYCEDVQRFGVTGYVTRLSHQELMRLWRELRDSELGQ